MHTCFAVESTIPSQSVGGASLKVDQMMFNHPTKMVFEKQTPIDAQDDIRDGSSAKHHTQYPGFALVW